MPNPNQHLKKKEVAAQRNIQYTRPRVIVRNLSFKCTSEDLSTCFSAHGKVKNITIPTKPTGEMRGFAFIEFDSMQEAKKAVEKVNGTKIVGRIVAVDLSLPKDRYDSLTVKEDEVVVKEEESATDDVVMGDESVKEVKDAEDEEEDVSEGEVEEGVEGDDTMEVDDSQVEPASFQKRGPSLKGDPEATLFIRNLSFESQEEELLEM